MCLSAEVDLALGTAVGLVGIDALRHVTRPRQWPIAALPLLFGIHQIVEAVVWWGLDGTVPHQLGRFATWTYLIVAFILPTLIPVAAARLEPDAHRRPVMWACAAVGAAVSAVLLAALVQGGPQVTEGSLHLDYRITVSGGGVLAVLYVAVTCGAFLASSDRRIALVGLANLAAVVVLSWLQYHGVISLWCAWAAVVSFLIAADLRAKAHQVSASSPASAPGP